MTGTTLEQKLMDTQTKIQQSTRRATLRASYVPFPDFDPPPTFRRQALPTPPQFVAAVWKPPVAGTLVGDGATPLPESGEASLRRHGTGFTHAVVSPWAPCL